MHQRSINNCEKFLNKHLDRSQELKLCEVGAEGKGGSYRHYLDQLRDKPWTTTTFDLTDHWDVDVTFASPEDWKLSDEHRNAYDAVICGQCLEHVSRPWKFIHQLVDLGKPGGLLFLTAPNSWEYHAYPIDCWRIWPDGMRALFEDAGITEIECYYEDTDTVGIGRFK